MGYEEFAEAMEKLIEFCRAFDQRWTLIVGDYDVEDAYGHLLDFAANLIARAVGDEEELIAWYLWERNLGKDCEKYSTVFLKDNTVVHITDIKSLYEAITLIKSEQGEEKVWRSSR